MICLLIYYTAPLHHIFNELVVVLVSSLTIFWLFNHFRQKLLPINQLTIALTEQKNNIPEAGDCIIIARKQFSSVIRAAVSGRDLSTSEQATGMALLKGLSLKEIARIRHTLEKPVRQQASSIYK